MESILWAPHRFFPCQSMCECATINSHCIYEYVVCCLPMVWWWLFSSFLHCPMAALKPQFQRDEMPTTLSISIITRAHTTWFNSFFGCLFTMYHSFYVDFSWIFTLKSGFCCSVQQFQLDRKKIAQRKTFPRCNNCHGHWHFLHCRVFSLSLFSLIRGIFTRIQLLLWYSLVFFPLHEFALWNLFIYMKTT